MRVAIYSPYLDTFGGGEKYMMTIAEILSLNNEVDILLDHHLERFGRNYLKDKLSKRFDLNLDKVKFISGPIGEGSNAFQRISFFKKYDLLFYLTDGSIFYPGAKRNILHIQSPLIGQSAKSLWGKIKLREWNLIIYNSEFTKMHAKENWPLVSQVIYPPVDIEKIGAYSKTLKKKKYILSVGRFFGYLKAKKHEVLIKAFKDLYQNGRIKEWSLHLVGSAGDGDKVYLDQLKKISKDVPINFYPNLDYDKLIKLYGESSIYWHAAGFRENDPTKMEHFGISTVEAMAGGCVPVVINKGGQTEIVEDRVSGRLWDNLEQLKDYTVELIEDNNLMEKMSKKASESVKKFSKEKFSKEIMKII